MEKTAFEQVGLPCRGGFIDGYGQIVTRCGVRAQFSGLHDVSTGHTLGRQMVTAPVGRDLEKTWQRIERVEDLAVRPVMTFECSAAYGDFTDEEE